MKIFDWLFGKKEPPFETKKECCSENGFEELKKEKKKDSSDDSVLRIHYDETEKIDNDFVEGEKYVTHYKGEPLTGICYSLYNDGNLKCEETILNGLKHGSYKMYMKDGTLIDDVNFTNNKIDDEDKKNWSDGVLKSTLEEMGTNTDEFKKEIKQKKRVNPDDVISRTPGIKSKYIKLLEKYNLRIDKDDTDIYFEYNYDGFQFTSGNNNLISNEKDFLNNIILNLIQLNDYYTGFDICGQIELFFNENIKDTVLYIYLTIYYDRSEQYCEEDDEENCREIHFDITDNIIVKIKDEDNRTR